MHRISVSPLKRVKVDQIGSWNKALGDSNPGSVSGAGREQFAERRRGGESRAKEDRVAMLFHVFTFGARTEDRPGLNLY